MKSYSDKLKDPRWQLRRLEVIKRDYATCRDCNRGIPAGVESLHVHHLRYFKDRDPWDYPDELLTTLCEKCHKKRQLLEDRAKTAMAIILGSLDGVDCESGHPEGSSLQRVVEQLEAHAKSILEDDGYTEDIIFCWGPEYDAGIAALNVCKSQGLNWTDLAAEGAKCRTA